MAALIPGLGVTELIIILIILTITVGIPLAVVLVVMRSQRTSPTPPAASLGPVVPPAPGGPAVRCSVCDNLYAPEYDACPYCAARPIPAV